MPGVGVGDGVGVGVGDGVGVLGGSIPGYGMSNP